MVSREKGFYVLTNGTDTHSLTLSVPNDYSTGADVICKRLRQKGILTNKTPIPFDSRPLHKSSGIRMGTTWLAGQDNIPEYIDMIVNSICSTFIEAKK